MLKVKTILPPNSTWNTASLCLLLVLLTNPPLVSASEPSLKALKQHYAALEQQYKTIKNTGKDLSSTTVLVSKIKQRYREKDKKRLKILLDELELLLTQIEKTPLATLDTSAIVSDHPALKLLINSAKSQHYFKLLLYKGNAQNITPQGALGRNKKSFSDVGVQRDAIWLAKRAILENNPAMAQHVLNAIEYTFSKQSRAGYFKNGLGVSARTAINADAFFLAGFAQIHFLLSNSHYQADYLKTFKKHKPALVRAMSWLEKNKDELQRQDGNTTNRLLFDAQAFILNGQILHSPQLISVGDDFLNRALAQQRSDGSFNEHGGYDSSYQAVSLLNLAQLWVYSKDETRKKRILSALKKGISWQKTRISNDGRVRVAGNQRTGLGQEKFFGKVKEVNYPEVAMAFFYWAYISDEEESKIMAERIVDKLMTGRKN